VLAYDKRGAGASTGKLEAASFEDLADDLLAGVRALRSRSDINPIGSSDARSSPMIPFRF
jgi:hypothetical protein